MSLPVVLTYNARNFRAELTEPLDITLALRPDDLNVNCYYAAEPSAQIIRAEGFTGSVAEGGSVNYQTLTITPHGNGTHTECYGHISADPEATLLHCMQRFSFMGALVTLSPAKLPDGDLCITAESLKKALQALPFRPEALVVRSLPNSPAKATAQYSGSNPVYFEGTCGKIIADAGIEQLVLDTPSFDREQDGGRLEAHKGFWNYPDNPRRHACITELVYIPDSIPDGLYLVSIDPLRLNMDASPSRVLLYNLKYLFRNKFYNT